MVADGGPPTGEAITARIKKGLAVNLLHDLIEWRQGDEARFSRMVSGNGKQIGDSGVWLANLSSICNNPAVLEFCPELPGWIVGQLEAVGLTLPA